MTKSVERYMSVLFFFMVAFVAVASRWMPHPPNFTAVSGFFFVCGVLTARNKWFLLASFAPMLISDAFLGWYPGISFVYAGHLVVLLMGLGFSAGMMEGGLFRKGLSFIVATLSSSLGFFILSNMGVWFSSGIYEKNLAGLVKCFVMALPFFHQTVIAQMVFATIFVGGYYWLNARLLVAAKRAEKI